MRRAISYAIDRNALVKAVLFGNGQPANSIFPPQLNYYDPSSGGLQYNVAAAKAAMAKSSVPKGFTTTLLLPSGNSDYATIATIVQAELKPLGVDVLSMVLGPTDTPAFRRILRGREFDGIADPDEVARDDPHPFMRLR